MQDLAIRHPPNGLLRRLGRSWIYRRVRKTADVQLICLATSDRHRILRTGVPRGTCQAPGISKTTQAVSITGGIIGPLLLMLGLSIPPASSAALLLNVEGLATM